MLKIGRRTYNDEMRKLVRDYVEGGNQWPTTARTIAAWLFATGKWHAPRYAAINKCAQDISRAMREEYIIDAQGRRVRAKHAATIVRGDIQLTLWDDIRTANKDHMEIAFQQRRQQIVGDCTQLRIDVDSFNDNNDCGNFIQLSLNFENDVVEAMTDLNEDSETFTEKLRRQKPR